MTPLRRFGLSTKLLLLTVVFVMIAEVMIFVPSIANFRVVWLSDRITSARLASLAGTSTPDGRVPEAIREELLRTTELHSVAIKQYGMRRLVLAPQAPLTPAARYDLRDTGNSSVIDMISRRGSLIIDALDVLLFHGDRTILVVGHPMTAERTAFKPDDFVEIILHEAPLRRAMLQHGLNILILSIIISLIAAALVFFALNRLLVRPMRYITASMLNFSQNPQDQSRIIIPSDRTDEVGTAERELEHMQRELSQLLHQKTRLAELGLAVSKINHDLRNMLASAQLLSDRLSMIDDPAVQSFSPKLIASLDRAINLCNETLQYGRAEEQPPRRYLVPLAPIVEEVADGLGLPNDDMALETGIEPQLMIDADRDQLYRVLNNLVRNAVQALEANPPENDRARIRITATRERRRVLIEFADNGPGIPEHIREKLFKPFQSSTRKDGSGLGLAIAAELIAAHGGQINLAPTDSGTAFQIDIPDRLASSVPTHK